MWLSRGDGTFDVSLSFPGNPISDYVIESNNYNYQIGDFNGDGKTDLIHFATPNNIYTWISNQNLPIYATPTHSSIISHSTAASNSAKPSSSARQTVSAPNSPLSSVSHSSSHSTAASNSANPSSSASQAISGSNSPSSSVSHSSSHSTAASNSANPSATARQTVSVSNSPSSSVSHSSSQGTATSNSANPSSSVDYIASATGAASDSGNESNSVSSSNSITRSSLASGYTQNSTSSSLNSATFSVSHSPIPSINVNSSGAVHTTETCTGNTITAIDSNVGVVINLGNIDQLSISTLFFDHEDIDGSNYNDRLIGNEYNNIIRGNGGNDFIYGAGGADTLIGGAGNDTFKISSGADVTRIKDFEFNNPNEKIDLGFWDGVNNMESLKISSVGSNTEVMVNGVHKIILEGVLANEIGADNFIFSDVPLKDSSKDLVSNNYFSGVIGALCGAALVGAAWFIKHKYYNEHDHHHNAAASSSNDNHDFVNVLGVNGKLANDAAVHTHGV